MKRRKKIFLTERDGWAQADIEADSLEEAEEKLARLIRQLEMPHGTVIVGELQRRASIEKAIDGLQS